MTIRTALLLALFGGAPPPSAAIAAEGRGATQTAIAAELSHAACLSSLSSQGTVWIVFPKP